VISHFYQNPRKVVMGEGRLLNDVTSLDEIAGAVIRGDAKNVARLTREAIDARIAPGNVLEEGLLAGMSVIGARFKNGEIFVPDVLIAVRAMKAGMTELEPLLAECGIEPVGRFVIGTVKGDVHDIGKNLVSILLGGAGFDVIDLGVNVPIQSFIEAIRIHRPQIIGMSALLTTTMVQMRTNMEALRKEGLLNEVKVMVGGAPVTARFAEEIGAHGYGRTAGDAVDIALQLVKQ
jgi:5-methyltetrahydrofolate--homocysteine methyltransferase